MLGKNIIEYGNLRINVPALHDWKLKMKVILKLDLYTFHDSVFNTISLAKHIIYAIQISWISPLPLDFFQIFNLWFHLFFWRPLQVIFHWSQQICFLIGLGFSICSPGSLCAVEPQFCSSGADVFIAPPSAFCTPAGPFNLSVLQAHWKCMLYDHVMTSWVMILCWS